MKEATKPVSPNGYRRSTEQKEQQKTRQHKELLRMIQMNERYKEKTTGKVLTSIHKPQSCLSLKTKEGKGKTTMT